MLAAFQDDFVTSLWADQGNAPSSLRILAQQPGFTVYRNTVMKGCIEALEANYPAIRRLVGEEWFRAAAALYVRAHPPTDSRLLSYGDSFSGFLRDFPHAADLPYLEGVAILDRFWTEAHAAGDADTLLPSVLASLTPEQLGDLVLVPHPAARWAFFDEEPIYTLWQRNREELDGDGDDLDWRGEGALITRPAGKVQWTSLDVSGLVFLNVCHAGQTLASAAEAVLEHSPHTDLAQLMASLLEAGAFKAQLTTGNLP